MKRLPQCRWRYVWSLPLIWLPCGILAVLHPGDKNLSFYFATFPGAWLPEILKLHFGLPAFASQTAGALLVVTVLGVFMDLLRVSHKVCLYLLGFSLVLAAALVLKTWYFGLDAVLMLLCWSIYLVGTLSIIVELGRRGLRRLCRTKPSRATSGSAPSAAPEAPEG